MFENKTFTDFVIEIGGRKIDCHKSVLFHSCPYFSAMFSHSFSENEDNLLRINDCDHDVFYELLRFLYCGEVKNLDERVFGLLPVADQYGVLALKQLCEDHISNNMDRIDPIQAVIASGYGTSDELKKYAFATLKS